MGKRIDTTSTRTTPPPGRGAAVLALAFLALQETPPLRGPYLGQAPPEGTPELFAPGVISTPRGVHTTPVFSPDGNEVYWTDLELGTLFMQQRAGRWSRPAGGQSASCDVDSPALSPDGEAVFYVSDCPAPTGGIWTARRTSSGWTRPELLDAVLDDVEPHWQLSVSRDGTLYFAATSPAGAGRYDIYRSRRVEGRYGAPEHMGEPFNTPGSDATPFIAPDGSYLLFASTGRPGGFGGSDLYVSFREPDGTWGAAVNLGADINSESHDLCPAVSPDGAYLFFTSSRSGAPGVYWVGSGILERLRPARSP